MLLRTLLLMLRGHRGPRTALHDVTTLRLRVTPADLDVLGHLNNGVYLSFADLGRMHLMMSAGLWPKLRKLGWYPVMANETITFRRSLVGWQAFDLQSRVVGYDAKGVFVEQRFVVDGEIYASAMTRGRFLKKSGGIVTLAELGELAGVDPAAHPAPGWVSSWSESVQLPPSKASAPSTWS